ncbi:hypothetical protein MKW94_009722 [Papaver nudicaule]|uniref:Uncharacterized protein n=1 Tax=Papaver nudicaule TaxID=74823 RepID=A0AA41S7S1_PAPNU|nr:hypothetical protein [Papaver nudicaule]
MRQNEDENGIQISNPNNPLDASPQVPVAVQQSTALQQSTFPTLHEYHTQPTVVHGTLSKTSMLANWLPTRTLLTFEIIIPFVAGPGLCTPVKTTMMILLLCLCVASCFLFHFTDSFRGPDGTICFGNVTPTPKDERYKLKFSDFVHALMSAAVFVAIHVKEIDEATESLPSIIGVFCSGLYLVFTNTRYGSGFGFHLWY